MFAAPPPVVQAPITNGCPFSMMEAIDGSLLDRLTRIPLAGANFCSSTLTTASCPGPITEGANVIDFTGGAGGSEPPGCKVIDQGMDTSVRLNPDVSM